MNALRHTPSHTMQNFVPGKPLEFCVLYDDVVKMAYDQAAASTRCRRDATLSKKGISR